VVFLLLLEGSAKIFWVDIPSREDVGGDGGADECCADFDGGPDEGLGGLVYLGLVDFFIMSNFLEGFVVFTSEVEAAGKMV